MSNTVSAVAAAAPGLAVALLILAGAKLVFSRTLPFRLNSELVDRPNPAIGIFLATYLVATAFALTGTFFGLHENPPFLAAGQLAGEGLLALILIRLAVTINDRLILYGFDLQKEIRQDKNLGAAFCVGGSCLASGLVINGALVGFSHGYLEGLRDIVVFWASGQIALVVGAVLYRKLERFDVHRLIEFDNNTAAGLSFGGFLLGIGIVLRASLIGAGLNPVVEELTRTAVMAVVGMVLLVAVQRVVFVLLVPVASRDDEVPLNRNLPLALLMATASIGSSLLLGAVIQR